MRKMVQEALSGGIAEDGNTDEMRDVQDVSVIYPVFFNLKEEFFVSNFSRIVFSHERRRY